MSSEVVEVTVAMVTWNSARHLPAAFASFSRGLAGVDSWRVVVADNDSSDGTVDLVRQLCPSATIVRMGRNAGFAAGLNAAVRTAGPSRAYLFLNPDVRLGDGCVASLLEVAILPGVGITVPRLVDPGGRLQLSLRREPTVVRALGEAVLGGHRAGRHDRLGEVVADRAAYARTSDPDWATGAAMLLTRECLDAVGEWDEGFFLYSEETDFALRARDAGYRLRYCPQALAVHIGGDSHVTPHLYSLLTLNRLRLFRRRHGRMASAVFRGVLVLNEGLRSRRPVHRSALRALLLPREQQQPVPGWTG